MSDQGPVPYESLTPHLIHAMTPHPGDSMGTSAANFLLFVAAPAWLPLSAVNDGLHNASAAYINFVATKLPFAENDSKTVKALKFLGGVVQPVLMPFAALWWKGTGTPLVVWEMLEKAKEHDEPAVHAPEHPPAPAPAPTPTPSGPATAPTGPTSSLAPAGAGGLGSTAANALAPLAAVLTLAAGGLVWIQHQDTPSTSGPTPVVEPVQGTGNGANQPAAVPGDPGPAAVPPIPALPAPIAAQSPPNQGGGAASDPATNGSGTAGTGGVGGAAPAGSDGGGSAPAPAMPASDPGHTGTLPGPPAPVISGEGVVTNPDPGGAGTPPIGVGGSAGSAPAMPGSQPAPGTGGGGQVAQAPAMPGSQPAPDPAESAPAGTGGEDYYCQSAVHSCPGGTDSFSCHTSDLSVPCEGTDPTGSGGGVPPAGSATEEAVTDGAGSSGYTDPGPVPPAGSATEEAVTDGAGSSGYTDPGLVPPAGSATEEAVTDGAGVDVEDTGADPGTYTAPDPVGTSGSTYTDPGSTGGGTSGSTYIDPSYGSDGTGDAL